LIAGLLASTAVTVLSLALLLATVGIVLLLWVRSILLMVGEWLRKRGYSDLFVTDLTVALPMALGIVLMVGMMAWLFQ
jgi:hypothetical protein